jgi:hypothetical protein
MVVCVGEERKARAEYKKSLVPDLFNNIKETK